MGKTKAALAAQRKYYGTAKGRQAIDRAQAKYVNTWPGRAKRTVALVKARSKLKGLDFDLDVEWVLPKLKAGCEITGLPFKHIKYVPGHGRRGPKPLSPSVDRIDPTKGYTKENCRVVLFCVNTFLQTMTDKQALEIAEKMVYGLMDGLKSR